MAIPTVITAKNGQRGLSLLDDVRESFVNRASEDLSMLRPIVARSWYRSRAAGVHPSLDRAVLDAGRVDETTTQVAEVHLRQLDDVVAEMGGYVSLTSPNGVLVKPDFIRDDEGFPEGYSLLEESSGSNGEGLALEEGRGVWLAPEEHFREDMRQNWCFASLIRDPFHNRVRAVVGLTLPADRVRGLEPSSTLLMLEGVASRIETEIGKRTSSKERALLSAYLTTTRRRGSSPVLALDGKNTLLNSAATAALSDADCAVIAGYAQEVMVSGRRVDLEVILERVGAASLEISPVGLTGTSSGAVVVVRSHERSHIGTSQVFRSASADATPVPPGDEIITRLRATLDGVSAPFQQSLDLARTAIVADQSVIIIGEAGTGKRRLADAIASFGGSCIDIDAAVRTEGFADIRDQIFRSASEAPAAIVIEHADEFSRDEAIQVSDTLKGAKASRVILTATRPTEGTLLLGGACNALEISVAPLRTRREDIPVLASAIADAHDNRTLSRALLTTLTNSDWPRNIDHLHSVVADAAKRARGSEVTEDDLPQSFQKLLLSGKLSRLEEAELIELRLAMKEAKGNRRLAAEMLEIGRSTLYRRMDYFRSRGFDF